MAMNQNQNIKVFDEMQYIGTKHLLTNILSDIDESSDDMPTYELDKENKTPQYSLPKYE